MKTRSRCEDNRVCIHEAAHIVAGFRLWLGTPDGATVDASVSEGGEITNGHVKSLGPWGAEHTRSFLRANRTNPGGGKGFKGRMRKRDEGYILMSLAGLAAEHRRSRYSMEGSASLIFREAEMLKYGFPSTDLQKVVALLAIYEPNQDRRDRWFRELCDRTCRLVWECWSAIQTVAAVLQEKRTVDREGIEEIHAMLYEAEIPQQDAEEASR